MTWDDVEDRVEQTATKFAEHPKWMTAKWTAGIVVIILVLSVIGNAFGIANIYWGAKREKLTASPRVTKQIYGTESIIQKVTLFHDRCTGVQEKLKVFENNYERLQADRSAAREQSDPLAQHAAIEGLVNDEQDVTAALNAAQSDARDYNSAAANPTIAPFRTIFSQHGLPTRIDLPAGQAAAYHYQLGCG